MEERKTKKGMCKKKEKEACRRTNRRKRKRNKGMNEKMEGEKKTKGIMCNTKVSIQPFCCVVFPGLSLVSSVIAKIRLNNNMQCTNN